MQQDVVARADSSARGNLCVKDKDEIASLRSQSDCVAIHLLPSSVELQYHILPSVAIFYKNATF
ncbi:MAG: hypothetical protein ABID79_05420 [Elusimicrobiota bacterium]